MMLSSMRSPACHLHGGRVCGRLPGPDKRWLSTISPIVGMVLCYIVGERGGVVAGFALGQILLFSLEKRKGVHACCLWFWLMEDEAVALRLKAWVILHNLTVQGIFLIRLVKAKGLIVAL